MCRVSANKNVLSSRLNSVRQMSCCRSSTGRLFHSRGNNKENHMFRHSSAKRTASLTDPRRLWLTRCRRHGRFPGRAAYVPDIGRRRRRRCVPAWPRMRAQRCVGPASYISNSLAPLVIRRTCGKRPQNVTTWTSKPQHPRSSGDSGNMFPASAGRVYLAAAETDYRQLAFVDSNVWSTPTRICAR